MEELSYIKLNHITFSVSLAHFAVPQQPLQNAAQRGSSIPRDRAASWCAQQGRAVPCAAQTQPGDGVRGHRAGQQVPWELMDVSPVFVTCAVFHVPQILSVRSTEQRLN